MQTRVARQQLRHKTQPPSRDRKTRRFINIVVYNYVARDRPFSSKSSLLSRPLNFAGKERPESRNLARPHNKRHWVYPWRCEGSLFSLAFPRSFMESPGRILSVHRLFYIIFWPGYFRCKRVNTRFKDTQHPRRDFEQPPRKSLVFARNIAYASITRFLDLRAPFFDEVNVRGRSEDSSAGFGGRF